MWNAALPLRRSNSMRQNYSFLWELAVTSYAILSSVTGGSTSAVMSLWCYHELPNDWAIVTSGTTERHNLPLPYAEKLQLRWWCSKATQTLVKYAKSRGFFEPLSSTSATFLPWSNFSKHHCRTETLPCPGRPGGNIRGEEPPKVRHLDAFFPNQLSAGLYYMCKAKSWPEKTTCYRVLNINTNLKYLYFVL